MRRNKLVIKAGERYNRLTILKEVDPYVNSSGKVYRKILCQCDCGNEVIATLIEMCRGRTQSCGCLHKDRITKHGHARRIEKVSSTYIAWQNMKERCLNPKNKKYKDYGLRGIQVCDRWLEGFENFLIDMGECPKGLTLERINNNGNYEPDNCKWATYSEQNKNRRHDFTVSINNRILSMPEAAKELKMLYSTFYYQYRIRKYPIENIIQRRNPLG